MTRALLTILILCLWVSPAYAPGPSNPVVDGPHEPGGVLRDVGMRRAIRHMGPRYDYRIKWEKRRLEVSTDHGKTWRRLRHVSR